MSLWGLWAGKNNVYLGELMQSKDDPPGLFLKEETDEQISKSHSLYDIGNEPSSKEQKIKVCIRDTSKHLYEACRNRDKSDDAAFKVAYPEIVCEASTYFPENKSWILRNLTTKEFIRSEAIAIKPEYIHGPFIDYLGFREVIAMMNRLGVIPLSWDESPGDGQLGSLGRTWLRHDNSR